MKRTMTILAMALVALWAPGASAHEGEEHAEPPGQDAQAGPAGTIVLSDAAIQNLGIRTAKATLGPRAQSLNVNGVVELLPERQAIITSPATGTVAAIAAKIGERVRKGQVLLTIRPIFVGSSPVPIYAPLNGHVAKQNVVLGQAITPETPLMEVGDTSQVLVRGVFYETVDVGKIKVGQTVHVSSQLIGAASLPGVVQRVDSAFERGSRTFNVYALIDNAERRLLAHMYVLLAVEISPPTDVLTVPSRAVLGEDGAYFLFVRNGNSFERRNVKLGARFGADREILEGVFPDEDVVIVGNYQLQFARSQAPAPAVKKGPEAR